MADLFYNKTVTIWNKYVDGVWEQETWIPTLIEKVRLVVSRGNNIMSSGLETADTARLHIKDDISIASKDYKSPVEWNKLSEENKRKYYTLESENDTFFVEGDTTDVSSEDKDNFFEYMKKNYDNCFKLTSVDRFEIIPHFECWGK